MKTIFADAFYWVALANDRDHWHAAAVAIGPSTADALIVTSEPVLSEMLAGLSDKGPHLRVRAARMVRALRLHPLVEVVYSSHELFQAGLELYEGRLDTSYSLVDCTSMALMKERGITEVLTHDHHFEQEGFVALLRHA